MRTVVLVLLSGVFMACARLPARTPAPPGPIAPAPDVPEVPAQARQRLLEPGEPAPVFVDPERRARLASAFPAIDAYLQSTVERDRLVGLAAGIVIDGELAWARGYGLRDLERKLPVETDTAFGIGSITKTVVALAILKLRDDGRLDLDRPAEAYLPELNAIGYPSTDSPRITIRHLLTHRSGLPRMGDFSEYPATPPSRAEFLATLAKLGLERAPGERQVYSNLGFQLLGPLIDAVAGIDHRVFVRDEIFAPLGMSAVAWRYEDVPKDRIAVGYERDPGQAPRARPPWHPGAADAAGGLYASVEDMARYAAFNLAAWPPRSGPETGPLRRATVREAHTVATLSGFTASSGAEGSPQVKVKGAGLGFGVKATCRHPYIVAHNGKTLSHRASLHMLPDRGVAVILLSNLSSVGGSVISADGEKILDLLADTGGLEPRQHAASPALLAAGREFAALLQRWDPQAYRRLLSDSFRSVIHEGKIEALFEQWRGLVGSCSEARALAVQEPLTGTVALACDRGALHVKLDVAPWPGPQITGFNILGASGLAAAPPVNAAAARLLRLLRRWDSREFSRLFTPGFKAAPMREMFAKVNKARGRCELGAVGLSTPRGASWELRCERGTRTLRLQLDANEPTRIAGFKIESEAAEGPCQ